MYKDNLDLLYNLNESSIPPPILIDYEPGARHFSFLANYISNITTTNLLSLFAHSADCSNSAPNKHVTQC